MEESKVIFGYTRVSTEEQAQHGISVDAQRDILNGYAAMRQLPITIYSDPGFSGKDTNRPALQRLLKDCRRGGVDTVIVWKLDRLSRSLRDTLTIIEDIFQPMGITLVSVTESIDTSSPSGRMMLNMLASFAQLEREQDSDRVVMSHKHLSRDCLYLGGHVPFGYTITEDKHYALDPVRAPIARKVFEMYMNHEGYNAILIYLNSDEIFPLSGRNKYFTKQDILYMIKNEVYNGTFVRRFGTDKKRKITNPETIRIPGGVPALITMDEYEKVQEMVRNRKKSRVKSNYIYPVSGLVHCAACGRMMYINHGGKTRSGEIERYYKCSNGCVTPVRLHDMEKAVYDSCSAMAENEMEVRRVCALVNEYIDNAEGGLSGEIAQIENQIISLNRKAQKITSFISENGSEAPASLMEELKAIDRQKLDQNEKIRNLRQRQSVRCDPDDIMRRLRAVKDIEKLPRDQARALIHAAVSRVDVSQEEFNVSFLWHKSCGDEAQQYLCHTVKRVYRPCDLARKSNRKRITEAS